MLEGIAQIDSQRAGGQVQHVLVLTDGMANRGVTGAKAMRQIVERAHARGILKFAVRIRFDRRAFRAL